MATQHPSNPFMRQGVIRDSGQFFGRTAELNQIFNRLRAMQSVSIVGERRIGKSSLLYHVFQTGNRWFDTEVRLAYTDLPDVTDEPSFYRRVCRELGAEGSNFSDLERVVRGKQVVVCLDEFEKVAEPPTFSRGFFDSLRSLGQSGRFALLVATQHSLADLCRTERIATSPFWNIFARVNLGLFAQQEAEVFIHTQFDMAGIFISEEEVARLLQLAGRFPFFLQLACYHLYEMKAGRTQYWEPTFEQEADDYLRYLWSCRIAQEQAALRWVLGLGGRVPDDRTLWELERRGLSVKDDQKPLGFWVFSEVFERLVRNPPEEQPKGRFSFRIKKFKITLWPPAIEIEEPSIEAKGERRQGR